MSQTTTAGGQVNMPSPAVLKDLYLAMLRIRLFEERVAELAESGEVHTPVHLYIGQEAVATGVCAELHPTDLIWGNHRSHGHYLAKGGNMRALMAEILCKSTGCAQGRGGSMHIIDPDAGVMGTVPMVAATIPIAVGAALSARILNQDRLSVAFFGDGATEEGVFHEALNYAALNKLPIIFVCENNLYSSHLPLTSRRAVTDLSLMAVPYGIPGVRVDGNDVSAVYQAAKVAAERARGGEGPTLLECATYRWRGHVGPRLDLDVGIRDEEELAFWMKRCPIQRLGATLVASGAATPAQLDAMHSQAVADVADALDFARKSPYPDASEVMQHIFTGEGGI